MSDDFKPLVEAVQGGGWFFAGLTAVWGIVLRWIVGRHMKQFDEVRVQLRSIDLRLSAIEGRFKERDRGRHSTRPGDHR